MTLTDPPSNKTRCEFDKVHCLSLLKVGTGCIGRTYLSILSKIKGLLVLILQDRFWIWGES